MTTPTRRRSTPLHPMTPITRNAWTMISPLLKKYHALEIANGKFGYQHALQVHPYSEQMKAVHRNIRHREDYASGTYLGDKGQRAFDPLQVRIASTNINKNAYRKCTEEITHWMTANVIDFLILADADLPTNSITHFWTRQQTGPPRPGYTSINNSRISVFGEHVARVLLASSRSSKRLRVTFNDHVEIITIPYTSHPR